MNVIVGDREFSKVLAVATARFIPGGKNTELCPNFPAEAAILANERDTLRKADPYDPRISNLNLKIRQIVNQQKRTNECTRKSSRAVLPGNLTLHFSVDKAKQCVIRRLRKMPKDCAPLTFTDEEVRSVIGPVEINMPMLKHLGSTGVSCLTKVLNLSLTTTQIPDVWKIEIMIPLLKPRKSAN